MAAVDASTETPATICCYATQDGDPDAVPHADGAPSAQMIWLAAWSDGRLVCRGDGGFEGELGRVETDGTSVAAAQEAMANAIEAVPIEQRFACVQGQPGLVISVSRRGSLLRLAISGGAKTTDAMQHAWEICEATVLGLIPEHARRANPPAPNFEAFDPTSVRFEIVDARSGH